MKDVEEKLRDSANGIAPPTTTAQVALCRIKVKEKEKKQTVQGEKRKFSFKKNGVWAITAAVIFLTVLIPVAAIAVPKLFGTNIERAIRNLRGTFVDMTDVAGFGVWNAPDENSSGSVKPKLSNVTYLNQAKEVTEENSEGGSTDSSSSSGNDSSSGSIWGDKEKDELYDWESDYDWDPTKANVLVSVDEDGGIKEVVYERENARGQVRQNTLGNAAMVYVSQSFTYVMYVDDQEWEFWKEVNFAQEAVTNNGFHCHHESMQTIVIHNETGKVYALKDIIEQVSDYSGALNYTMQAHPTYDNYVSIRPLYGNNLARQWYKVEYDDENGIKYRFIHFEHEKLSPETYGYQKVQDVRYDKYGQEYIYAKGIDIEELSPSSYYCTNEKTLVTNTPNVLLQGTDNRVYTLKNGVLQVFGENFELSPVENGLKISLEGVADYGIWEHEGIVYHLEDNYLYSMFGEVWQISENGTLIEKDKLKGEFPAIATHGYLINGEIFAFIIKDYYWTRCTAGKVIKLSFGLENGVPSVKSEDIIFATEIAVQNHNLTVFQHFYSSNYQNVDRKFYRVIVKDGVISTDYIAYQINDGYTTLTKPIIEALSLN